MRLLVFLLISLPLLMQAQEYNFTKRILHKISRQVDFDTTIRDTLDLKGAFMKIKLDTIVKKLYVQSLDTFDLRDINPIKKNEDVTIIYCKGNITCTYWGPWLFINYPYKNKWWYIYDFTLAYKQAGYSN